MTVRWVEGRCELAVLSEAGPCEDNNRMREMLADSNLLDLQAMMNAGTLSGAELTAHFLERIHRLDSQLNAVIARF